MYEYVRVIQLGIRLVEIFQKTALCSGFFYIFSNI